MLNWLKDVGGVRGRRAMDDAAGFEKLESRMFLDGAVNERYDETTINWHGAVIETIRNSWILTFRNEQPKAQAEALGRSIAQSLGLQTQRVEATSRGRFVNLVTNSLVTEATAATAVSRFGGYLMQLEPNAIFRTDLLPNDARFGDQWALRNTGQPSGNDGPGIPGADIDAELTWNLTTGSDRVVIAIIDTGVDINHPDLRSNIWTNPLETPNNGVDDDANGFIDDVNGWDFASPDQTGQDNDPSDPVTQGHGTAVAGVVGAVGGNGIGIAGVAWNVSILPIKIFPAQGGAGLFSILNAYDYIVTLRTDYGVNIVATNNSYGALRPDDFGFDAAQEEGIRATTDAGALFVVAAGNDSIDNDGPLRAFPSSYTNPDIISAAATTNRDLLAGFSNYGLTSVDVGAPGQQVLTCEVGGGYQYIDGTSFASPYTAGVIAVMAAVNRYATPQQLKASLLETVDLLPALQGRVVTGGRINAFRAVSDIAVEGPIVSGILPGIQTPPISQITVQFSEDINPNPLFFNASQIRLQAANGDNRFDGNDLFIALSDGDLVLDGRTLTINLPAGELARDLYRLRLFYQGFRDFEGNFLNGDSISGFDEVYDFTVVSYRGPLEPNDTIMTSSPIILDGTGFGSVPDVFIGDGDNQIRDVDIFRVFVGGPALISAVIDARSLPFPSTLDSYLRLFDASGVELGHNDNFNGLDSKVEVFVPAGGQYYLGVSAYPNAVYNPILSGAQAIAGGTTGNYNISVQVAIASTEMTDADADDTPVAIPNAGTILSQIFVADGRTITDVNVTINVAHTFVSDLRITLTGPTGGTSTLVNRRGGAGSQGFQNTVFNDQTFTPIAVGASPFSGSYRPETPLTVFNQSSGAGFWTLRIEDLRSVDGGTLNDWSLQFTVVNDVFGPFELNDTVIIATDLGISGRGSRTVEAQIGDGAFGLRDVDLFRVFANTGTTISVRSTPGTGSALDTIVRIFDSAGVELASDKSKGSTIASASFIVSSAGNFYIGVSGGNTSDPNEFGNDDYDPIDGGSGSQTDATGPYTLTISIAGGISEGSIVVAGNSVSLGVASDGSVGVAGTRGIALNGTDFLPGGTIESFFGLSYDGFIVRNAGPALQSDLGVTVANESDYANRRVNAKGVFRDLTVNRSLSFGVNDRFVAVDIRLTNNSTLPVNDLAWMEGFNPDQALGITGSRNTTNNVWQTYGGRLATSTFGGLTIGLASPMTTLGVYSSFEEPGTVRDPFQVILTPDDPDPTGESGEVGNETMAMAFNLGSLDGLSTLSFRYFILLGSSLGEVVARFQTLDNDTGTGHLVPDPIASDIPLDELPYSVYYPEGYANSRANTFVPIINGNDEPVRVVVIARYEGSATPDVLWDTAEDTSLGAIGAHRRAGLSITTPTLYANGTSTRVQSPIAGRDGVRKMVPYALEIRSSLPVGATFSHYDFNISTGEAFTSILSDTWTFGTGRKGAGLQDAVVFYNPTSERVKVTLTLYPGSGGGAIQTSTRTVDGFKRGGWLLSAFPSLANGTVGVKVDAEAPIVAGITHFDIRDGKGFASLGTPADGATTGATGEGEFGLNSSAETVSILNTNAQTANITFTFSFANGSAFRKRVNVAPETRSEFTLQSLTGFPAGQAYSVTYTSNRAVAVTLESDAFGELVGSALSNTAATQWLFSEGFRPIAGDAVTEYLRIYNPTAETLTASITINFNNGETETFLRTITPRAANVFNIHDFVTGSRRFQGTENLAAFYGLKVQAALPIVAFMGHFDTFLGGGFGTLGTPLGTLGSPT